MSALFSSSREYASSDGVAATGEEAGEPPQSAAAESVVALADAASRDGGPRFAQPNRPPSPSVNTSRTRLARNARNAEVSTSSDRAPPSMSANWNGAS